MYIIIWVDPYLQMQHIQQKRRGVVEAINKEVPWIIYNRKKKENVSKGKQKHKKVSIGSTSTTWTGLDPYYTHAWWSVYCRCAKLQKATTVRNSLYKSTLFWSWLIVNISVWEKNWGCIWLVVIWKQENFLLNYIRREKKTSQQKKIYSDK